MYTYALSYPQIGVVFLIRIIKFLKLDRNTRYAYYFYSNWNNSNHFDGIFYVTQQWEKIILNVQLLLVAAAATSTMYIIMAALRILMAFGLGKLQDDPQLPPMTFDGNIWLTFANIFWFWQHFLVSLVHTSCRFFVFQVHGQDIENLIVVFTLLLKQQCKYIYI